MANILAVGIATVDVVFVMDCYPAEDSEVRATSMTINRGGNGTNTLAVLAQLGHECAWAGVLAEAPESQVIKDDLARYGIDRSPCRFHPGRPPTSSIVLSRATGSRTIVHYRDLPEFGAADLARADLAPYDWVHFEGRNVPELGAMIAQVRHANPHARISLEAEKSREGLEGLLNLPDLLLCSRAYAASRGCQSPEAFLAWLGEAAPEVDGIVAWGEYGAYGRDRKGRTRFSPAFPPPMVVDTLGAGDTFNAAAIHATLEGADLEKVLEAGCRLAGRKCGQAGLHGLTG